MIQLERIFDVDNLNFLKYQSTQGDQCETVNLGTNEVVKNVHIGKVCMTEEKEKILRIMREFSDVIEWGYEDLKT